MDARSKHTSASPSTGASEAASTADSSPTPAAGSESGKPAAPAPARTRAAVAPITNWVYQLQDYRDDKLDEITKAPAQAAVIDPARDASRDYFSADEISTVKASGKKVFAYFEIGSIEDFRPEYAAVKDAGLTLDPWEDWPGEYWVKYWDTTWWDLVIRNRVDQAIDHGFDGVYLDTPLAYEELDLTLLRGETRESLARKMVDLIVHISQYAKGRDADFWIIPQNSPELRHVSGYTDAIDGIGMEELFFLADDDSTDMPCDEDWCAENLDNARALRDAGKQVLAVDYAVRPENVRAACARYTAERFAGYVTTRALDTVSPRC